MFEHFQLSRRRLLLKAAALPPALVASATLPSLTALATARDQTLVIAKNTDDIIGLDPGEAFEVSGCEVVGQVYDRLVRYEAEDVTKLVGAAAESWSVVGDGRSLQFKLRPGQVFASGNPLTAEDVTFSFQRVVQLETASAYILNQLGWTKKNVTDLVKAVDPETVELTVDKNLAPGLVLQILSTWLGSIVDKKTALANEKNGDLGNEWLRTHSAGSGPYTLKSWQASEAVVLDANPKWRNPTPAMTRVVVRHVPEPSSQRILLEKGDVDIARDLTKDQTAALASNEDIRVITTAGSDSYYMALNQKVKPLSHPKVWEALRYAVDYDGMESTFLKDRFSVRQTFLPSSFWGSLDYKPFGLDLPRARALLAEAGYPEGFEVRLDTFNRSPFTEIAQSLQQTMGEVGVKLSIVATESKQFWTLYRSRRHELALSWWAPDYLDPHSNAVTYAYNPDNSDESNAGTRAWRCSWESGLNDDVDTAAGEGDESKRLAQYHSLQRKLTDDSPYVFLFEPRTQTAMRKGVEGFVAGPSFDFVQYRLTTKGA